MSWQTTSLTTSLCSRIIPVATTCLPMRAFNEYTGSIVFETPKKITTEPEKPVDENYTIEEVDWDNGFNVVRRGE